MADIRFDSEPMLHQMAAKSITSQSASRFVTVLDICNRPLVLSLGNDNKFYALQANDSGTLIPIDLGKKLGVSDGVQAFSVSQNQESGELYIAFAAGTTDGESKIYVLKAISPSFIDVKDVDFQKALLSTHTSPTNVHIRNFHINPAIEDKWPSLIAVWNQVKGDSSDDAQIARVEVLEDGWHWRKDVKIHQTVKGILDICTLYTPLGQAVACLYKYGETKAVYIVVTEGEFKDNTTFVDPVKGSEPQSIVAILDEEGLSTLYISGSGLSRISARGIWEPNSRATLICKDHMYDKASRLTAAQTGRHFVLWFRSGDRGLGYHRGLNDDLLGSPVPLLPNHTTADFAPLLDPKSISQSLVVLGEKNELSHLMQSADTYMWKAVPLMQQALDCVMDVKAFVTHIEVKDVGGMMIPKETYSLSCSGWTRALINGRESPPLSQEPIDVQTNERGVITIVVPAKDITSYVYTLSNAEITKQEHRFHDPHTVDPALKVQSRIAETLKDKKLSEIETRSGKLLDGTAKKENVDAAEHILKKQLPEVLQHIRSKSSPNSYISPLQTLSIDSWLDKTWEWIESIGEEVANFVVEKSKDVWHFVVHVAGEIWAFALDTATAVLKAVSWILEKIGAALEKIWEWLSYLFNLGEIKEAANSLRNVLNSFLTYGEDFIKSAVQPVEDWANGLEDKLMEALEVDHKYANEKQSPKDHQSKELESVSTAANVGFYQFEQGLNDSGVSFDRSRSSSEMDLASALYRDIIEPTSNKLKKNVEKISDDIHKLFSSSKSATINDLRVIIRDVARTIADGLKDLVVGMVKLGADLIKMFKEFINTPFSQFPIIGPLLEQLGFDSTFLDVIVYVLAVPVTVFSKLITSKPALKISQFNYKDFVERNIPDIDWDYLKTAINQITSYVKIVVPIGLYLYGIYQIFTVKPKEETFSLNMLIFKVVVAVSLACILPAKLLTYRQALSYPFDSEAPGWGFILGNWGARLVNIIVHGACLKLEVSPKIVTVIDVVVETVVFSLIQVVHHYRIDSHDKYWGDGPHIGFSVTSSVFVFLGAASTTAAILIKGIAPEAVVIAAGCGACTSAVATGTAYREYELQ